MARKLCIDCGERPQVSGDIELCNRCSTYAEWENEHSDHAHDRIDTLTVQNTIFAKQSEVDAYVTETKDRMQGCPVCHPNLDPRTPKRTGHTNTVAKSRTSHAGCKHARTPRDRAECRKARTWNGERWV